MLEPLQNGIGLDIVVWLQNNSNAGLDAFAEIFDALGSSLFYMIFIPIFYWSVDKHLGRRLLLGLLIASASAIILKLVLKSPRPYIAHPDEVTPLFDEGTYGLPSGHATNATIISAILATWVKKRWFTVGAITYVILMGLSRIIAGVHYPQDVIGGILLGGMVFILIEKASDDFGLFLQQISVRDTIIILIAVGALLTAFLWNDEDGMKVTAILVGGGIGLILDDRYIQFTIPISNRIRLIRYGTGILMVLIAFFAIRILFGSANPEPLFLFIRYGIIGLIVAWIYPWAFMYSRQT